MATKGMQMPARRAAPIARRAFDYMLLGQYPSEEDMAAVQKGMAAAPIGKPRRAADMTALLPFTGGGNGLVIQDAPVAPVLVSTHQAAAPVRAASKPAVPAPASAAPRR